MMKHVAWCALAMTAIAVSGACGSDPAGTLKTGDGGSDSAVAQNGGDGAVGDDGTTPGSDATLTDGTPGDDANFGTGPDGSRLGEAGPGTSCAAFGGSCSFGGQCCSGICDTRAGTCTSSISHCAAPTSACVANTDCCSGACVGGHCGATQCLTIGATCPVAGGACCTGNCSGGMCQPIASSPKCVTANNTCAASSDCCSGLCSGGRCAIGSSYCIQNNDICYHANDCCGGVCSAPNGQPVSATNAGLCAQPAVNGQINCTGIDGSVCAGSCGSCCSRLCAPYGPTGVSICQPAQGCRVEGDVCRKDGDCCGGAGSGVAGDGAVVCSNSMNGGDVGVCLTPGPTSTGGTCNPEGDICSYKNYACGNSTKRSDCCGPLTPKALMCLLDGFGIPRCSGLAIGTDGGAACVGSGSACASAKECCNGSPCVPDPSGHLHCAAAACQPAGQSCTANGDCCPGLPCVALPGSLQGTCTPVLPPPGPPPSTDAGTGDVDGAPGDGGSGFAPDGGFSCALYGQGCAALPCCSGTQCISGKCSTF